jgi:protoporphyrinogen/coproporphyrinogen III oxidase
MVLERGPDSFLTEKPAAAQLCRELGLGHELLPSNDAARKTYIVVRNRLVPLPDGLMFLVPTKLIPTALSRLFSLKTKVRMGLELLHPPRPTGLPDEAVAALVERHFGREAVDRLADPLLSGIFGGDASQLSARTVLPRLVEMESEYGSLTRGMLAAHRKMRARMKEAAKKNRAGNGSGQARATPVRARAAIFTSLRGGMQHCWSTRLPRGSIPSVRLATPVTGLRRRRRVGESRPWGWEAYDAVIMASPAWAAGALLGKGGRGAGRGVGAIPYSSSITVNLDLRRGHAGPAARRIRLPGSGQRRPCDAGLHLRSSQVSQGHAAVLAAPRRAARLSGRDEQRGFAGGDGRSAGSHRASRAGFNSW